MPSAYLMKFSTVVLCPSMLATSAPPKAAGTEPSASQRTRSIRTVPWRKWTNEPTGFITAAATRSLDTAASGETPKKITSIGVISAPPPIPVSPTTMPTTRAPKASVQSTGVLFSPVRAAGVTCAADR